LKPSTDSASLVVKIEKKNVFVFGGRISGSDVIKKACVGNDITRVEKSCVAKRINRKKANEKYFIITNKNALPQTSNKLHGCLFAMFKNFIAYIHNC